MLSIRDVFFPKGTDFEELENRRLGFDVFDYKDARESLDDNQRLNKDITCRGYFHTDEKVAAFMINSPSGVFKILATIPQGDYHVP